MTEKGQFTGLSPVGLGTTCFWYGDNRKAEDTIIQGIREFGITAIDTAEMYGNGTCEEAPGRIIRKCGRENLFIVDKILPSSCTERSFERSLNQSLQRLGTDALERKCKSAVYGTGHGTGCKRRKASSPGRV